MKLTEIEDSEQIVTKESAMASMTHGGNRKSDQSTNCYFDPSHKISADKAAKITNLAVNS